MQTGDTPAFVRAATCPEIELKVASTRQERQGAFELLYRSYLRAGLCAENFSGMRATHYQLLPTTDIIVAKLHGEVISTVSLVRDNPMGLPMEAIYSKEVTQRRAEGLNLAEVTCLADRRRDSHRFFGLFCELSRLLAQLAWKSAVDELLVAVHPRHAALYHRYMAFQRVGEQRSYPTVKHNPAVALSLNFKQAQAQRPTAWREFFGQWLPGNVLQSCPISDADERHFRSILEVTAGQDSDDLSAIVSETYENQGSRPEPCIYSSPYSASEVRPEAGLPALL
jgi:hypothetical protein